MSTPRPPCAPGELEARVRQFLAKPHSKGCYYLHCFHAIGRGSFYAARDKFGVAETATVSRRMRTLAAMLGVEALFVSDRGGHDYTDDGNRLLALLDRLIAPPPAPEVVAPSPPGSRR